LVSSNSSYSFILTEEQTEEQKPECILCDSFYTIEHILGDRAVIRNIERTFFMVNSFNNVLANVAGNCCSTFPP
jgi:hypothetical protein